MKPNQKSIHPSVEFSVPELYEYTIPPLKGKCSDCNHPNIKQRCWKGPGFLHVCEKIVRQTGKRQEGKDKLHVNPFLQLRVNTMLKDKLSCQRLFVEVSKSSPLPKIR